MPKRDLSISSSSSHPDERKIRNTKQTTHRYIMKRESESKMRPRTMYQILPLDARKIMKFYRVYKVKNYNIFNLIDLINNRGIPIFIIYINNDILVFKEYNDITYDMQSYMGQHTQYSEVLDDDDLIGGDIMGKINKLSNSRVLFNDVDLIDNLYTNINGTIFYYINNMNFFIDAIKKDYDKSIKVKISKKSIDIGIPDEKTGGGKISYVKYHNYVRKIRIDKNKSKYIIINKDIIFLKDIKGKYTYL
jgi:hypothetical protein